MPGMREGPEYLMADDTKTPYDVLGVAKTASDADIKKAYRRLAKELHPDLTGGDPAKADRFKAVSAAYD
ncbi:MAG TPA: DnaJ domain-containing protein, partial [Paenirhodobacter sp.]